MAYNLPIVPPRKTGLERLGAGFGQGLQFANALQQMAARRRQEELAEQALPGQQQEVEAKLRSMNALTALREQQEQSLAGKKGAVKIGIDAFGRPFAAGAESQAAGAMPEQAMTPGFGGGLMPSQTAGEQLVGGANENEISQPGGAQSGSFLGSPIGGTARQPGVYFNPHTRQSISALTPTGRTALQKQLAAAYQLKKILPELIKEGKKGFKGPPLPPSREHYRSVVSQYQHPEAAGRYKAQLKSGGEQLLNMRDLRQTEKGFSTAEGLLGRLDWESDEDYEKKVNDIIGHETDDTIKKVSTALSIGGVPIGKGPIGAPVNIPSFQTREEGIAWFDSQPPEVQEKVMQSLGGA